MAEKIKVLYLASEADPFVKVGGLGDVAGSLPAAINRLNLLGKNQREVDIRLVIPYYDQLKQKIPNVLKVGEFILSTKTGPEPVELFVTVHSGLSVYLVSGNPISNAPGVYSRDFSADAEKFIFFSLACLQIPTLLEWEVDILHANDWHTAISTHALIPLRKKVKFLRATRSILTVHNLPFMGTGAEKALRRFQVPPSRDKDLPDWGRKLPLPIGLAAADSIVAVSPNYAREILTPEYGCGLEGFLSARKNLLSGIINGIDLSYWNPATDTAIPRNFSLGGISGKAQNKLALQKEFGFDPDLDIPLIVMVTRMDTQKGVDLAINAMRSISGMKWQVILLGTGDPLLEKACQELQNDFPEKVRAVIKFDTLLSRRMYAGADFLLMPSRYEPCGLAQMISMRYGCIPIARATGGLADTIQDFHASPPGSGFLYSGNDPSDLSKAVLDALAVFHNKTAWQALQKNAMSLDYSWEKSAEKYFALYNQLTRNM